MGTGQSLGPLSNKGGTRDLCRSEFESGTSEGVGLGQVLYGFRNESVTFEDVDQSERSLWDCT